MLPVPSWPSAAVGSVVPLRASGADCAATFMSVETPFLACSSCCAVEGERPTTSALSWLNGCAFPADRLLAAVLVCVGPAASEMPSLADDAAVAKEAAESTELWGLKLPDFLKSRRTGGCLMATALLPSELSSASKSPFTCRT